MSSIVELDRVSKAFAGGVKAVDDLSLEVREGEFLTMLGPSGCGKTTTLRMIGGFEYPDAGRVRLDGRDVTDLPPFKRPINMMFQDFALFPHMTVAQNIGYGPMIGGTRRADVTRQVEDALRTIELTAKAQARPAELSIGQRQRVALARALVKRPRVLLLDEPMSALDARLRESMQIELKRLHTKLGTTFVMVTHDQSEALVMSDRVMVMNKGRVEQIGQPTELYDRPASPYVATFLGNANMLVGRVLSESADGTLVSCGSAEIRATRSGAAHQVGDPVILSVRPEKIRIVGSDGSAVGTRLRGTVREQFFHGDSMRVVVEAGVGQSIMVHRQLEASVDRSALPAVGAAIDLAIEPESVSIFAGARA